MTTDVGGIPSACDRDLDGNGKVELADFLILSANFGNTRLQVVAAISSIRDQFHME